MQNASWPQQYPSNILPHKPNFPLPLTPPILIPAHYAAEIGGPLVATWFFSRKFTDTELVTPRLTENCWMHMRQSHTSAIFVKVVAFNCGQTKNRS